MLTRISGKKHLQAVGVVFLGNAEVGRPFTMDQDFIDLDLVSLARASERAVYHLARINLALGAWQSVHGVVGSKCILTILVDEEPGMDRKGMPGASESELSSELLGSKMDQVEPSWSETAISYQPLTKTKNCLLASHKESGVI